MAKSGLERRAFLRGALSAAVAYPFYGLEALAQAGTRKVDFTEADLLLSPCRFGHTEAMYDHDEEWVMDRWGLAIYDMTNQKKYFIKTPVVGHSVVGHPVERHKVLLVSQKPATQCCEVDLIKREVTQVFRSGKDIFFIGHAQFSPEGKHVYFTESQYGNNGFITKRNASTYAIENQFSTAGLEPHDMRLLDGGRKIMIANGGVKSKPDSMMPVDPEHTSPSVTVMASEDGKILNVATGFEGSMSARHLGFGANDETFVGLRRFVEREKAQMPLAVVVGDKVEMFRADARSLQQMKSWLQSVVYCEKTGIVAATAPSGGCVSFWDAQSRTLKKLISQERVDGIALSADQKYFISTSHRGRTMFVTTDSLEVTHGPWESVRGLNWRHNLVWKIKSA